jgi:meso-butanediol dehydrogenase/(S,S)-butanediol dehydrogenase/diacetyl reductase
MLALTNPRESTMGKLDGKVALVTGGGQGIGRGIALSLAAEGAQLSIAGRTESKLLAVADQIRAHQVEVQTVVCEVKDLDSLSALVDAVVDRFGTLDILVNNAQQPAMGTLLEMDEQLFADCWSSGPLASFRLMRLCYPHLRGSGVIINVSSSAAVNPMPVGRGVYAAAKAATTTLSRTAAVEWGPDGIRVITIMPAAEGEQATRFHQEWPEAWAKSQEAIPLRRLGDPETEIGRMVAILCSDDASYITGTTIQLDGGQAYLR